MNAIGRPWRPVAVLVGGVYAIIGIGFAAIDASAGSNRAAFVLSGLVFAAHLAHEHFRRREIAQRTAWHTAVAVALGGLGLAVWANLHDLSSAAGYRPRMLVALVAWPLVTAVPAFVVALALAWGLSLKRPHA